jgi:RNA polymerase sigma-70 factor, ECF subfamily
VSVFLAKNALKPIATRLLEGGARLPPFIRLIGMRRFWSIPLVEIAKQQQCGFPDGAAGGLDMSADERRDLTAVLNEVRAGFPGAESRLIRAVYGDLLHKAQRLMRRERRDHTLDAGALVHEAVLRLLGGGALTEIADGRELHGAAVRAMRQVLIDHARRHNAGKRNGQWARVPLDQAVAACDSRKSEVIDLQQAVASLAEAHPRQAQVVTLRFFGGLSAPEVADALKVSLATVESDWRFARAWLRGRLGGAE